MPTCPVCEHTQPLGAECDVCGKKLLHGPAAIPDVPPVDGFEPTLHSAVPAHPTAFPELEPTATAAAGDAPDPTPDPTPDLDPGRAAPVDAAGEPFAELERTGDGIPEDPRTAVPALVTCRYCHTPAPTGERVCVRCGMRLPAYAAAAAEDTRLHRQCGCGLVVTGAMCPGCGARLA